MNMKDRIMQAAIKCASEYSLTDLRMKHIGRECQISEANVYRFFEGKDDLLISCFHQVNQELAELNSTIVLESLRLDVDVKCGIQTILGQSLQYLRDHPDKAVFYFHFRNSNYYYMENVKAEEAENFQELRRLFDEIDAACHLFGGINRRLWWSHMVDSLTGFASRVVRGELPGDPETQAQLFELLYCGIQPRA